MMRQISSVNWSYIGDAIPAFVTVMFIPFGYSAAYGLIAGLMVYTALNGMIYLTKLVSCGSIVPDDEDRREYWTSKFCHSFAAADANTWASQAARQTALVLHG
jgi:AGZA family xanthine/uracil permease-like MFS transporter